MLPRLSLCHPQFIPSAAGHSELDPRSRVELAIAVQQSRRERDQEVKPNKAEPQTKVHLPPSITPERRSQLPPSRDSSVPLSGEERLPGRPRPAGLPPLCALPPCHSRPMAGLAASQLSSPLRRS